MPLQDLKKLAQETSTKLDGKLQEQLAALQAQLFEEKKQRADAEADAQVCSCFPCGYTAGAMSVGACLPCT